MKPIDMLGWGPTREAIKNEAGWLVTVTPKPMWGLSAASIQLTEEQYVRYLDWQLSNRIIQDCLPELSSADREILMTGIDPQQFSEMSKDEEV